MTVLYIYLAIVVLCFASSIINKEAKHNFLWLYFASVFTCEILNILKILPYMVYVLTMPIYILFFIYYFSSEEKNKIISWILAIGTLITSTLYYKKDVNYQIILSVNMSFVYIFLSLRWFFLQLQHTDLIPIFKKQKFWVSTSLLFFGIVFIFRMVPVNIFDVVDKDFLMAINKSFHYAVIISYLLFLKATTCKA